MEDLMICKQSGRDSDELEQVGEIGCEAASDDEEMAIEEEIIPTKPFAGYEDEAEDYDFVAGIER